MTTITLNPSTLENIDYSVFEWIDNDLNLFTDTNEGWKKVPVIFSAPERSFMSKGFGSDFRDEKYTLKYPMISISRKDIVSPRQKSASLAGTYFGTTEQSGSLTIFKEINAVKTAERANSDSKRIYGKNNKQHLKTNRIVYDIYQIPFPTFITVKYQITIRTNYQQQMNDILSPFIKYAKNTFGFKILRNGHSYEVFMDQGGFSNSSNVDQMNADERKFESSFSIEVLGYLMHGETNDKGPTVVIKQNRPEIKIKSEFIFTGSLDEI